MTGFNCTIAWSKRDNLVGVKYYTIKIDKVIQKEETPIVHTFNLHKEKMNNEKKNRF